MLNIVKTVIKHCVTGIDGITYDFARIGGLFALIAQTVMAGIHMMIHGAIDLSAYGIGAGAILGATGAAVGFKARTEPQGNNVQPKPNAPNAPNLPWEPPV